MYGIVNKAIEELVIENFGEQKWEIIKEKSGVDVASGWENSRFVMSFSAGFAAEA